MTKKCKKQTCRGCDFKGEIRCLLFGYKIDDITMQKELEQLG